MTPLHAVAIAGLGRSVPSIAELGEKPGIATTVIVVPGASADRELVRRVGEHLQLGAVVLLLFQDPSEASAFETKLSDERTRAARGWAPRSTPRLQARGARG